MTHLTTCTWPLINFIYDTPSFQKLKDEQEKGSGRSRRLSKILAGENEASARAHSNYLLEEGVLKKSCQNCIFRCLQQQTKLENVMANNVWDAPKNFVRDVTI